MISDIGGILGLWVGISAISLVEILQLFIDIFLVIVGKDDTENLKTQKIRGRNIAWESSCKVHTIVKLLLQKNGMECNVVEVGLHSSSSTLCAKAAYILW